MDINNFNNNLLSVIESKFDISTFNDKELELLQTQIFNKKFMDLSNAVKIINDKLEKNQQEMTIKTTELSNKFEDLKEDNDRKMEVTINKMRVDKNKWGFESQSDFGVRFRVSIGSKTVGLLFKTVKLAKISKTSTEPMRSAIDSGKATTEIVNGYKTFRWHHEKCLKHVENWLEKHELLEKFYSIDKERELKIFIQNLYSTYCNKDMVDDEDNETWE